MIDPTEKNGAPGEIRTPDRLVRRQVLDRREPLDICQDSHPALGNTFPDFCALTPCFAVFRRVLLPALACGLLAVSGCAGTTPEQRRGIWIFVGTTAAMAVIASQTDDDQVILAQPICPGAPVTPGKPDPCNPVIE